MDKETPAIGIRELKANASEIVRTVREERVEYVITHRGKPVAMIVPFQAEQERAEPTPEEWLANLREIGRQLAEATPEGKSIVQQLFDDREASQ
jgi:prevent-host-death family protein